MAMGILDAIMFTLIILWLIIQVRTGKRIYQPIGSIVYGLILVTKRFIIYVYRLNKRAARKTVESVRELTKADVDAHPYEVSLGKMGGKDFIVNIMEHHTLIGATSGGGKTYMLHNILKQLFDKGSLFFDNTDVYIIDLKGHPRDMFHLWRPVLAGYATRLGTNMDDALEMLRDIESKLGEELEKKILLIVDEAYILTADKEGDRLLSSIASQLRLNGALVLLVQHPQYAIVKTFIRYNVERRICGLVLNRDQAKIILDVAPKTDELPERVGQYLIREPGKNKLIRVITEEVKIPEGITNTTRNVIAVKAEELPAMKLLMDVIGEKKLGDNIVGIRTIAPQLEIQNAQNFVQVAYRNFVNAGIFEAPKYKGARYKLAVQDLDTALTKFKEYLPNWQDAPESLIESGD